MEFSGNVVKGQMQKFAEEETMESKLSKDKVKSWLKDIVKLPQYFDLLIEKGYYRLKYFHGLSSDDLKDLAIKLGHKKKLVRYARFLSQSLESK